jgi:hypothetical protein
MPYGLTVGGDNPYTFEFRDPNVAAGQQPAVGQNNVLIRWKIDKPECLAVSVIKDAGSAVTLTINDPIVNDQGVIVGYQQVQRAVPQKIKVTLDCGECTCGGEFTVTITYDYYIRAAVQTAWNSASTTVSITCAGPGCTKQIRISDVRLEGAPRYTLVTELSEDQALALSRGQAVSIDPKTGVS